MACTIENYKLFETPSITRTARVATEIETKITRTIIVNILSYSIPTLVTIILPTIFLSLDTISTTNTIVIRCI